MRSDPLIYTCSIAALLIFAGCGGFASSGGDTEGSSSSSTTDDVPTSGPNPTTESVDDSTSTTSSETSSSTTDTDTDTSTTGDTETTGDTDTTTGTTSDTDDETDTETGDPVCGDGMVEGDEDCDDAGESETCNADCTVAACGDGVTNATAGEACDGMGRTESCNADCTSASCGDGVVNATAGEACDDAGESESCNADCTVAACGDGVTNATAGEECDGMGRTEACNADCTNASCGDGVVNATAGEACDDGGESETCNIDCTVLSCGDGITNVTAGEACDDMGESASCDDDCTAVSCGDGTVNTTAGEACDDNGESASCDADCTVAECGDGVVNAAAGEECDGGPGCSDTCVQGCAPFAVETVDPATVSFAEPTLSGAVVGLAWDGTNLWSGSGGGASGNRLARQLADGSLDALFAPGIDVRSIFTQGDGTGPIYVRAFNSSTLRVQGMPGVFADDVMLAVADPVLATGSSVAWDDDLDEFISTTSGVVQRWAADGSFTGVTTLVGYGDLSGEGEFPVDLRVAWAQGCYLTYADGVVSSWDVGGERVDTVTVAITQGDLADVSFSYANGRIHISDGTTEFGYDVW